VIFHFANGIETVLAKELENVGVIVKGNRVDSKEECADTETIERYDKSVLVLWKKG